MPLPPRRLHKAPRSRWLRSILLLCLRICRSVRPFTTCRFRRACSPARCQFSSRFSSRSSNNKKQRRVSVRAQSPFSRRLPCAQRRVIQSRAHPHRWRTTPRGRSARSLCHRVGVRSRHRLRRRQLTHHTPRRRHRRFRRSTRRTPRSRTHVQLLRRRHERQPQRPAFRAKPIRKRASCRVRTRTRRQFTRPRRQHRRLKCRRHERQVSCAERHPRCQQRPGRRHRAHRAHQLRSATRRFPRRLRTTTSRPT